MKAVVAIIGQIVWKFLTVWLIRADAVTDANRKQDTKAHERMNDADLGIGAADGDHIKWMREFADRNKR